MTRHERVGESQVALTATHFSVPHAGAEQATHPSAQASRELAHMHVRTSRPLHGFTLVELLIVMAIIGILIALMLPALSGVREAARKTQCANNINGLAVALHGYHESRSTLPVGADCTLSANNHIQHCHTWLEFLLPFLEQQSLFEKIDFTMPNNQGSNPSVLNDLAFPNLSCPSDPDAGLMDNGREDQYLPGPAGTYSMAASYVPSGGPLEMNVCPIPAMDPNINCKSERGGAIPISGGSAGAPGMFAGGPVSYSFDHCRDGLSNTLLLGEQLPIYSTFMMYFSSHMNVATTNVPPNYHRTYTACPKSPTTRVGDCYAQMGGYKSEHNGGVQVAMADGRVEWISDSIDYEVYQYLGDRADGMKVPGDEF
ncbi:MAG: DUF1559 domain-containing protein [Pirellulales bacterium]|nr:DUF1559 domain-containing protein [Pirellulales bacterium]